MYKRIRNAILKFLSDYILNINIKIRLNNYKLLQYHDSMIFLYENNRSNYHKYSIGNGNLIYHPDKKKPETYCIIEKKNNYHNFTMLTSTYIDYIGLCEYLKKQVWVYYFNSYNFIEEGKLIDIIKRIYPTNQNLLLESLEKLDSMCPELEPFNEIRNN